MSLGICLKAPEGIVLAADSRVTIFQPIPQQSLFIPATYDNATKLLHLPSQPFIGMVTYGLGVIGQTDFRTPYSLLPELDKELLGTRMTVSDFAKAVSKFFTDIWKAKMPQVYTGDAVRFYVAGYNQGEPYGKIFWFAIPHKPDPMEFYPDSFGVTYDGQREFIDRLLRGYDDNLIPQVKDVLQLTDDNISKLSTDLPVKSSIRLPIQFLPLQDCVDLCTYFIRTTIGMQTFLPSVRGVGGEIDVATITRTEGLKILHEKRVRADKPIINFEGLMT
jgi:hypothetical protein